MSEKIKTLIKSFPLLYKIILPIYIKITHLNRGINVWIMILLLNFFPKFIYKFSKRKTLPSPKLRQKLKDIKFPHYEIWEEKSTKIKLMDEIHVFTSGCKDYNILKKINGPVFMFSLWDTLKEDEDGNIFYFPEWHPSWYENNSQSKIQMLRKKKFKQYRNENIVYVNNSPRMLKWYKKKGLKIMAITSHLKSPDGKIYTPTVWKSVGGMIDGENITDTPSYEKFLNDNKIDRLFVTELIFKPKDPLLPKHIEFAPTASIVTNIGALFTFAKKINIHGWNFYLGSSPNNMSSFQLLRNIYNYKTDVKHSETLFEIAILNLYYAYKYSLLPKINNFGLLGELQKHKKLISKIEKVFFD